MPDLKGTTVEFAASILDNLGLDYTISGIGTVYQQSIPSGTVVKKDTKVEIILKEESEY
ncbi:PASTA domain-containing protein [Clostridium celatum]|nr:PASTA domain-containing protein [Clostridium celatum]